MRRLLRLEALTEHRQSEPLETLELEPGARQGGRRSLEQRRPLPLPAEALRSHPNAGCGLARRSAPRIATLIHDLRPHRGRDPNLTKQRRQQLKIGKRREVDQRAAIGDNEQRSPRKAMWWQPRLDLVQIDEVGGQIGGSIVVMRNAAALRQLDELYPAQAEIVCGIGRGNAPLVEKPENRSLKRVVTEAFLGLFVENPVGDRDVEFNLHGTPIVPGSIFAPATVPSAVHYDRGRKNAKERERQQDRLRSQRIELR